MILTFSKNGHSHIDVDVGKPEILAALGLVEADWLPAAREVLCLRVDADAAARRAAVATGDAGQMAEYQEARTEALALLAVERSKKAIDPAAYPMLAASLGTDIDPLTGEPATDLLGVARSVSAAADAYQAYGAAVRKARLSGKAAIRAAGSAQAAQAAYDGITWPGIPAA
ncbi:hypothetical protein [Methylobacterium aquaticum]|uniref:hypothetical protein n=1 Tax=Methylobacterium aquaticum TaxID=270351 RepID=UPI0019317E10|nr:hypothetical protein [Methylobacterium aquaticum]QRE74377.1 hypothetical protein F1D61_12870 [Methylobacterium aquaticum]